MQKKIIAMAVAGLVSGAAFAQSNVTIYGLVDMGVSYRGDSYLSGVGSKMSFDSGIQSGNRIGFKGEEALGNGLKAGFVLETGLFVDAGGLSNNGSDGPGFGRQSFLYMAGGFGTVAAGRQNMPEFNLVSAIDPFGTGLVGQVNNLYTLDIRGSNVLAYVSPSFGGLTVTAAYSTDLASTGTSKSQEATENKGDLRAYAISPVYNNGPLMVGLNYHRAKLNDVTGAKALKVWDLGGTYNFGVAKLAGVYGDRKVDGDNYQKSWMLGVTVPFGASSVLASYTKTKGETLALDYKATQWAIGYQYDFSKRTNLYAAYADISNKQHAGFVVGDSSNGGDTYQNGLNIGIRHKF